MTAPRSAKSPSRRGGGDGWRMRSGFPECGDARSPDAAQRAASARRGALQSRGPGYLRFEKPGFRFCEAALRAAWRPGHELSFSRRQIMAPLVLCASGAAAGAVFGPAGATVGRIAGALVGNIIDKKLFGPGDQNVVGPRLADLDVMASTEGAPIARVYGRVRLAGQVIWATQLEEMV